MKRLSIFLITALFVGISVAQVKNVAVVETEIDAQSDVAAKINRAEIREISEELRREAVKNLPRDRYNIMTTETVMAQMGAKIEECSEENCVVTLGSRIGADYIVRGTVRKTQTRYTLSINIYETEDGYLIATSEAIRSENIEGLIEKTASVCTEMYKMFADAQRSSQKPPIIYTLTINVNPAKGGTVSRNPNQTYYISGTSVDVMAIPANGYIFTGWTGDTTTDVANITTITMSNNKMLTANFRPFKRTYTLTTNVSPSGGGVVTRSPDKKTYAAGETVSVTAKAADGYTFTDWTGATSSRKNRLTVKMDGDKTLTATFYRKLYIESKPEPTPSVQKPKSVPQEKPHTNVRAGGDSDLSNAYVLPGVYASYNLREGYRKYDGVEGYQHVENTNPFIFGLAVGRRISIDSPRLRFQAAVELGRGSVKDLEFEMDLVDKTGHVWSERVSLYSVYWTGGLLADAHLLFPLDARTFFVSAGLGAHLTYFDIAVKTINTGEEVTGVSGGMRGAISPSVNLGCGIEYKLDGRGAACISYGMRFWQSAGYKEAGELFPMGVDYTEFFFSQSIQLQYLLPRMD